MVFFTQKADTQLPGLLVKGKLQTIRNLLRICLPEFFSVKLQRLAVEIIFPAAGRGDYLYILSAQNRLFFPYPSYFS